MMALLLLSSVLPSGGACATYSAAMMPPAPGLLSTIMLTPFAVEICSATMREKMSIAPPGGTGRMTRMVLAGSDQAS